MTVRVRFSDLRSVTRSMMLRAPISATAMLAETAEELVRGVLAKHRQEKCISLLGISVSNLERFPVVQLEPSFARDDEKRRPGSRQGMARRAADGAIDKIRDRFGWKAVKHGAKNGSIIIMHANGRGWHTAAALPQVIDLLRQRGFELVTVSKLLQ